MDALKFLGNLPDNSVDSIITDPPYGVDYQSSWRIDKSQWKPKIVNDKLPYIWFINEARRVLKPSGSMLCFTRYDKEADFRQAMVWGGLKPKAQIIWDKVIHGMGDLKGNFAPQHENIIFAIKDKFIFPGKRPKSIIRIQRVNAEKLTHPNEKPVELLENLIQSVTNPGDIILDPFMGSFTTAVAAKNLGRNWLGCEIDENYCKLGRIRLENEI